MPVKIYVCLILITAPFALWGSLCALGAIDIKKTRLPITGGFFACVIGWGGLIAAALDYLYTDAPLYWPVLLLFSVLLLAIGYAAIYLGNRRTCSCPSCPSRNRRTS